LKTDAIYSLEYAKHQVELLIYQSNMPVRLAYWALFYYGKNNTDLPTQWFALFVHQVPKLSARKAFLFLSPYALSRKRQLVLL
jgi:hypothetical protein